MIKNIYELERVGLTEGDIVVYEKFTLQKKW